MGEGTAINWTRSTGSPRQFGDVGARGGVERGGGLALALRGDEMIWGRNGNKLDALKRVATKGVAGIIYVGMTITL